MRPPKNEAKEFARRLVTRLFAEFPRPLPLPLPTRFVAQTMWLSSPERRISALA